MSKKNLITRTNDSINQITIKDLPVELVELSEEVLSHICGGHMKNLCPERWRLEHNLGRE
jgi:hypothetical protein